MSSPPEPGGDLLAPVFRAHRVLCLILLGLTVLVNLWRLPRTALPVAVLAALGLMILTTALTSWAYALPRYRRTWISIVDLTVTLVLTAVSVVVLGAGLGDGGRPALTGFWAAGAPLALAILRGWLGGGLAALAVAVVAFLQHPSPDPQDWGLSVSLVIGAAGLGFVVDQMRAQTREREQVYGTAAAIAERQRLARIVHDGVLQVLAMVEREGRHLGPRGAMLARLAHEQEVQLRALLQDTDISADSRNPKDATHRNISVILDRHASPTVTVSSPADPLLMESKRAAELDAAITEALNNVAKHAGPGARAWVLLEQEGNELLVSIRDNGVGGDPQQFAEAMQSGRMGMKHSIYGRIQDLGGTATLRTAPGRGVEWDFKIPVEA